MDVNVVFQIMIKLFLILLLGYALNKAKILDAYGNKMMSAMIVNITSPLLIISSMSSSTGGDRARVLLVVAAGFVMYVVLALTALAVVKLFKIGTDSRGTIECMIVFSNNSFMGYPVVQSVLGDEAIFYTSMLHFSFNLFIYTYGVICLSGKRPEGGVRGIAKKLATPGLLLIITALLLYLTNLQLPDILMETVKMVGSITTPLSMIVLGSTLAAYPLKKAVTDLRCYGVAAIRLLLVPVITLAICRLLHVDAFLTGVAVLTNAMPVASMVVMFSNQYDGNKELASRGVLVSTTLSVLTIPLIAALL